MAADKITKKLVQNQNPFALTQGVKNNFHTQSMILPETRTKRSTSNANPKCILKNHAGKCSVLKISTPLAIMLWPVLRLKVAFPGTIRKNGRLQPKILTWMKILSRNCVITIY